MIASKVTLNKEQVAAMKVNTMNKTRLRRPHIGGELRDRVAEQVLAYVERNPGHQVPRITIAKTFEIAPNQVGTVIVQLVRENKLERLSKLTYRLADPTKPQSQSAEQPAVSDQSQPDYPTPPPTASVGNFIAQAKEYAWEHDTNDLRAFIRSLEGGGK